MQTLHAPLRILLTVSLLLLAGCASIAEGVSTALLKEDKTDTRICEITGSAFSGVDQALIRRDGTNNQSSVVKILMVHGIGTHAPGYSSRLRDKLVTKLGLGRVSETYKQITLLSPLAPHNTLGILRLTRHTNGDHTKELLFYELTWSSLSDAAKESLSFDNSGDYTFKRATLNTYVKGFLNDVTPDILTYRGKKRRDINRAVGQAACWMFATRWDDFPKEGKHTCNPNQSNVARVVSEDDFVFITHSLGSRVTIDMLSLFAEAASEETSKDRARLRLLVQALQNKRLPIFMLANQLPLLDIGASELKTTNQHDVWCDPAGARYKERLFDGVDLVAVSDPNDLLSYPLPPFYRDQHMDSRLCVDIRNVTLNVVPVNDKLGVEFANPVAAHTDYDNDDRVIALIANGLGRGKTDPLIANHCRWIETIRDEKPISRDDSHH